MSSLPVLGMKLGPMLALALLSDAIVAAGDVAAKKWTIGGPLSRWFLSGALFSYLLVSILWLAVLRLGGGHLGKASLFWVCTGAIVPVLVGRFGFGEVMTWNVWVGMACCAAGLILTSLR